MFSKSIGIFGFLFSIMISVSSVAATPEQLKQIKVSAEQYVTDNFAPPAGGKISALAANIDSRIHATDCPSPLITSSNSTNVTSNITVLVRCEEDNWRVYVPVRVNRSQPLIITNRALARGEVIAESDLSMKFVDLNAFRRFGFSSKTLIAGAKVKRNIKMGDVVEQRDICVVCRNESVMIKAVKGEMSIITNGTALSDASLGEQVRVKNDKSQRIIEGRVSAIGEVTVNF
ncbi:flagellar basal body P-ring formation chaperone FlgA [Vibrio maerlii]|uniref:flagellar basal body P-ring formation chaperone FlgA n=1 Tax=Vibrio maerlii TaxID=2231648 RepID=UPI001F14660B|nr:flagellar basal body P-ring formation chaperone FlgA [Vibrio maerlii]